MKQFIRLHILAEGQTEERFVKDTLSEHLGHFQISTDVRSVYTSKDKNRFYRGGLVSYQKARKDIQSWLKEDANPEARFTTMFDLYALPNDFPLYKESKIIMNPYQKVESLENALKEDISDLRFIPYIQLHEFETLVLANPNNLALEYFDNDIAIQTLQAVLDEHEGNPELINENPVSAPSKRIIEVIPDYDKVNVGAGIAGINGIDFLKNSCKHFKNWVDTLEIQSVI
ncbi:hypothetical protein MHK_003164 [Candidatus Magnetomorum sp. HK-1]|nr:hypothetical protein MHK_003164 [Candidatus Magnetomorum sp. HK-1]